MSLLAFIILIKSIIILIHILFIKHYYFIHELVIKTLNHHIQLNYNHSIQYIYIIYHRMIFN